MINTPESKNSPVSQLTGKYQLPPLDFLQQPDRDEKAGESKDERLIKAQLIQLTLALFNIEVSLGDITTGPTITRYELNPAPGVKLETIVALANNLAAALKAERIHILAPIPGTSFVGIEVPNAIRTKVVLRELLESDEWRNSKARIPIALGKDVYGHVVVADLAGMPHLLIGGSTGSGKSVCINSIIVSLLYRFTPEQLRFAMIDPMAVELQQYNHLPNLVGSVATQTNNSLPVLRWVMNEIEERYKVFACVGVRNFTSFNDRMSNPPPPKEAERIKKRGAGLAAEVDMEIFVPEPEEVKIPKQLSHLVVIISELADLMLVAPAEVEMIIARITQMGRAAGIHCIIATQRPNVGVVTGVIKANIPGRIAFQVASRMDSRTILDATGADGLLGQGDMLFLAPGSPKLTRIQGAFITNKELQEVVEFVAKQGLSSDKTERPKKPDVEVFSKSSLGPQYTFESFVVGHTNNFACAAAKAVADSPGDCYNPLFIYGSTGVGKTHLLHAIGNHISRTLSDARVDCLSAETLTGKFIEAVGNNQLKQFREKLLQNDVLLIDDIQFLAGKERLQEEFFHLFNAFHAAHKQIVMTCNCPPGEIPRLEQRLVSRFEWGMLADLQPLDHETRQAILRKKAQSMGTQLPDDTVIFYG